MTVFDRLRFHHPVKAVYVALDKRILHGLGPITGRGKGDWSISLHEPDLLAAFGNRVRISMLINTDLNAVVRTATFTPPLAEGDIPVLHDLLHRYNRRLADNRRPLQPPLARNPIAL
jgi:hypothetical protein